MNISSQPDQPNPGITAVPSTAPRIDAHVHLVGNGLGGSGCWLRLDFWHRPLARFMSHHIGLGVSMDSPAFDEAYVQALLRMVRGSDLDAIVLLAQEAAYDRSGNPVGNGGAAYVPNSYVLSLANSHPEFLAGISIHPGRRDALRELDDCLERNAVLLKCLPNCQNIDCADPKYRPFWNRMAEAGLPLLAHTGGEHTLPVICSKYADPRNLRAPLEAGVKVIAAHCGTKSGLLDPDYFPVFLQMLREYPNLYGDSSAFNVPIRGRRVPECLTEPVRSRIVHGSDFPVPVLGHWGWVRGYYSLGELRKAQKTSNILQRDYLLKKAMGFGPEHFTGIGQLLRPIPGRLIQKKNPGLSVRG